MSKALVATLGELDEAKELIAQLQRDSTKLEATVNEIKQQASANAKTSRTRVADLESQLAKREAEHKEALNAKYSKGWAEGREALASVHQSSITTLKATHAQALAAQQSKHDSDKAKAVRKARLEGELDWPSSARTRVDKIEAKMVNKTPKRETELKGLRMRISGGENALNELPDLEEQVDAEVELAEFRRQAAAGRALARQAEDGDEDDNY